METASTNPTNEKNEDDDYVEKKHDSELSATSDIEMMEIDDDDDPWKKIDQEEIVALFRVDAIRFN